MGLVALGGEVWHVYVWCPVAVVMVFRLFSIFFFDLWLRGGVVPVGGALGREGWDRGGGLIGGSGMSLAGGVVWSEGGGWLFFLIILSVLILLIYLFYLLLYCSCRLCLCVWRGAGCCTVLAGLGGPGAGRAGEGWAVVVAWVAAGVWGGGLPGAVGVG